MAITHRIEAAPSYRGNPPVRLTAQLESLLDLTNRQEKRSLRPKFSHIVQWTLKDDVDTAKKTLERQFGSPSRVVGESTLWRVGAAEVQISGGSFPLVFLFYTNYKK